MVLKIAKNSKKLAKKLIHLDLLQAKKNLLAFSGGVDSTCLFYLLLEKGIDFDLAIVDYGIREESKNEIKYVKKLAKKHNKQIFAFKASIIKSDFENQARKIRYDFFRSIIQAYSYENLILAHQLNDRVEWLLMQLSKGCGLNSLLGFDSCVLCGDYTLIRPLSNASREEIVDFLKRNKIRYFVDKSNKNTKYKRNYFRKKYVSSLVKKYAKGLLSSLEFLKEDFLVLYGQDSTKEYKDIFIIQKSQFDLQNLHSIDVCAKKIGYVISQKQRKEIIKSKYSCILGDKIVIDSNAREIFVCSKQLQNHKENIDKLRILSIPPKIRPFIAQEMLEWLRMR